MVRKILTAADVPEIDYKCICGGTAKECEYALTCVSCRHRCKQPLPDTDFPDPQKKLRGEIEYAKYRRRHRRCFDCKHCAARFISVECVNPVMKDRLGGK